MNRVAQETIAERTTHSAAETITFGRELAAMLPAALVLLCGDLGAGKTTLVKGIAEGLGAAAADDVTSPTFTLVHEYSGGSRPLYHLDLYRLEQERELAPLGIEEMEGSGAMLLVEWGEKFPRLAARAWGVVRIAHADNAAGETTRQITVTKFLP